MPYIRVKSETTGHEFDVDPGRVPSHPEWSVIDSEPVDKQRPPKYGKPKRNIKAVESAESAPVESSEPVDVPRFSKRSAPSGD